MKRRLAPFEFGLPANESVARLAFPLGKEKKYISSVAIVAFEYSLFLSFSLSRTLEEKLAYRSIERKN